MTTTQKVITTETQMVEIKAEGVGANLMIHRTVTKDEDTGTWAANGDGWAVSMRPSGFGLVQDIRNRYEAREVARRLGPVVAAFRAAVEHERAVVQAERIWGRAITVPSDDSSEDNYRNAVAALAAAVGITNGAK